jgi:hypothetical protein
VLNRTWEHTPLAYGSWRYVATTGKNEKKRKRKMNKYVLPSVAALLILVIGISSFTPVMAVSRITLVPYLQVVTIPEDDQQRQTGIMSLGVAVQTGALDTGKTPTLYTDFMSQHKLLITLNGMLVATSGIVITCNVAEKDKEALPPDRTTGKSPLDKRQFPRENLKTVLVDVADMFICKARWKPGGMSVGVLDVYYTGEPADTAFIADHILIVHVTYTVGRQVFYGTEIQDICVLGWSMDAVSIVSKVYYVADPHTGVLSGRTFDQHQLSADPLKGFSGCEELTLYQRSLLHLDPFDHTEI